MTVGYSSEGAISLIGLVAPSTRPRSPDVARRLEVVVRTARVCSAPQTLEVVELLRDLLALATKVHDRSWLTPEDFGAHALHHASECGPLSLTDALVRMRGADLYLALACGLRNPAAIAELERWIYTEADLVVAAHASVDEVRGLVRDRLLSPSSAAAPEPLILAYPGVVSLRSWLRVAAVRQMQALRARLQPTDPLDLAGK